MLGQRLNIIIFLFITALMSCGRAPEHSGAPQFIAGQILVPGDGSGLSIDRRAARTWRDYDGDGVSDRFDWDIDGDGVPNLLDQYPYDEKKWGDDLNANGIADFIDLRFSHDPKIQALAPIQERIFQETGVTVIQSSAQFSASEWKEMEDIILSKKLSEYISFKGLKVIVKYDKNSQIDLRRADFDSGWKQMSFYPNPDHQNSVDAFRGSLVHEFGHVHAAENPRLYADFLTHYSSWTSPSSYGQHSPEEGYAEEFALKLFNEGLFFDFSRFDLHHNH